MNKIERLHKNINGYRGETIDINAVLEKTEEFAREKKWSVEIFYEKGSTKFFGFIRKGKEGGKNIYISSGIHGDEPAGPLAINRLLEEDKWDSDLNLWMCPVLNPLGFTLNTRENEKKIDLNREYRNPKASETIAHIAWFDKMPMLDLSLNLHEDWESSGFYILEPEDQGSSGRPIIEKVKTIFPINISSTIEGFPANNGVVSPKLNFDERAEWPEAFWLVKNKGGVHFTFEAASDYPLQNRVTALVRATELAIENLAE